MNPIASCCCGNISIEIEADPHVSIACHCDDCKKRTGSAFGLSIYIKDSQIIKKKGQTSVYKIEDKIQQERHFCFKCGTTLFWKASNFPDLTGIAGGCFTDTTILEPEFTFSNDNKCDWLELPESWKTNITQEAFQ